MRRAWLSGAVLVLAMSSACGLLPGSTSVKLEMISSDAFTFDDVTAGGPRYLRMSGIDLCTDGDDPVTVTGVRLVGSNAPQVVAFRVSRSEHDDEGPGSSAELGTSPVSRTDGPSEPFSHACGDEGRVSLTIDSSFDALPVETGRLEVSYRTGGDDKVADLEVPVVLCSPTVGCPGGADD